MGWDEVYRLTERLLTDPSSHVCAAVVGLRHPWSREAFVLADVFDVLNAQHAKRRPKPYARPSDQQPTRHGGGKRVLTQEQIDAALARVAPEKEGADGG